MVTYPLKVVEKCDETAEAASLWLEVPRDLRGAFRYRPGQFLTIEKVEDGQRIARQYSLSSSPDLHENLRISVKRLSNGLVSSWLVERVHAGDHLEVQVPRGRFFRGFSGPRHAIMLACGSGIAPILSIARSLLQLGEGHRVTLVLGNRSHDTVILKREVDELATLYPDACSVEHVLSRADKEWMGPHGRIDRAFILARLPVWLVASELPVSAFLCGPQAFMDLAEATLANHGISPSDIHRESFDLVLNDDEDEPGLPLLSPEPGEDGDCERIVAVVGGEEYVATPEPGESILAALLRSAADVPYSCQEGTCASCISKLTAGSATVRPGVLQTLRQADLDEGLTLACLSRPTTRHVRIDFDDI